MKKIILSLMLFISIESFAQISENCRTRIELEGNNLKIVNKDSGSVKYVIERTGFPSDIVTSTIGARDSIIITIPFECGTLTAYPTRIYNCTCLEEEVTITRDCNILSVKFLYMHFLAKEKVVKFMVSETTNLKSFTIYTTMDGGKTFQPYVVKPASVLKANVEYSETIKIK